MFLGGPLARCHHNKGRKPFQNAYFVLVQERKTRTSKGHTGVGWGGVGDQMSVALQLPSPLLRADPLQSPSGLTHGVSDREPICDAGCSQGDQKIEAKSTLSPNPNLQVLFFFEQASHSSSCSQSIIFPVGRREGLCPSTSGISEEAKRKLTHSDWVPGASSTEPVNRKLQVHSAGHPGVGWFVLQPFGSFR